MKAQTKALIVVMLSGLLTTQISCKATKAIDSTIDMNKKMDEMLKKMDQTNRQMGGMEKVTGNGMNGMSEQMGEMLVAMKEMLKLGDKAGELELLLAFDKTVKKGFNHPSEAAIGATKFTEVATADQLIDVTYVYVRTLTGVPEDLGHKNKKLTDEEKQSLLYGMMAIAYTIPPEKLQEIIQTHIVGNTKRIDIAKMFLAFRAQMLNLLITADLTGPYIKEVLMSETISRRQKLTNFGKLKDVVQNYLYFNELFTLEFKDDIYHDLQPTPFKLTETDASVLKMQVEALKHAIENWLDCAEVSTPEGKDQLNDIILELKGYFEQHQVELPNKQCQ
jgi:hypothetical protein